MTLLARWLYRHLPLVTFVTALTFALYAFAQPDPEKDPMGLAQLLLSAIMHKQWPLVVSLVLGVVVWAGRKWGAAKIPFLATKLGGVLLNFGGAGAGALAAALLGGVPFDAGLVFKVVEIAVTAAGGWSIVKSIYEHVSVEAAAAAGAAAATNVAATLNK